MNNNENKKIVIKIGTSSITNDNGRLNLKQIDNLAFIISDLTNKGYKVALVSSGAISAGVARLNLNERPKEIALKQAVACVGQNALMEIYNASFARYGYNVGQLLLSKYVFTHENFSENAKNSLMQLWNLNCIPIINENDSISADEIKLGDNDNLSSFVAKLIDANTLILLTDIDGVYDKNPKEYKDTKVIRTININDFDFESILCQSNENLNKFGTGGIKTKINACVDCVKQNINACIANSKNLNIIYDILENKQVGTHFVK